MEIIKVKVKAQALTSQAFRSFGQVLADGPALPEVEAGEGRVGVEITTLRRHVSVPLEFMAIHFSYSQAVIPLKGVLVLVVAPKPRNRDAKSIDLYELDYEKLAAFVVEPGQGFMIDKGVWHNFLVTGADCVAVNVTRKNPGEGQSNTRDVEDGRLDLVAKARPYVEFVNLKARDSRLISVDL